MFSHKIRNARLSTSEVHPTPGALRTSQHLCSSRGNRPILVAIMLIQIQRSWKLRTIFRCNLKRYLYKLWIIFPDIVRKHRMDGGRTDAHHSSVPCRRFLGFVFIKRNKHIWTACFVVSYWYQQHLLLHTVVVVAMSATPSYHSLYLNIYNWLVESCKLVA